MIGSSYDVPKRKMNFMLQCSHAWGLPPNIAESLGRAIEKSTLTPEARNSFGQLYSDIQRTAEDQCYHNIKNQRGRHPREDELNNAWMPLRNAGIEMNVADLKNRMGRP
jgi:hypothetical protein